VQGVLVTFVVLVLGAYVVGGVVPSDSVQYTPFVTRGIGGIATATAFVFVSYAGIGEVASVAEEITDPGRNIPRAMLISIGVMMVIYTAVVGVIVGIVPADTLIHGGRTVAPRSLRWPTVPRWCLVVWASRWSLLPLCLHLPAWRMRVFSERLVSSLR